MHVNVDENHKNVETFINRVIHLKKTLFLYFLMAPYEMFFQYENTKTSSGGCAYWKVTLNRGNMECRP